MSLYFLAMIVALSVAKMPNTPVPVQVFVMSKCPDATDWEDRFASYVSGLAPIMALSVDFIAAVDPSQPSGFSSMHGPTEVAGDFFELCAAYLYPNVNQYYPFLTCLNQDRRAIPQNAQLCVVQSGLDWNQINSCANGPMAKKLLSASIARTNSAGVKWSPTIFIGGREYCQWHTSNCTASGIDDFRVAICQAYTGSNPPSICA